MTTKPHDAQWKKLKRCKLPNRKQFGCPELPQLADIAEVIPVKKPKPRRGTVLIDGKWVSVTLVPDGCPMPLPLAVRRLIKAALAIADRTTWGRNKYMPVFVEAVDAYRKSLIAPKTKTRAATPTKKKVRK